MTPEPSPATGTRTPTPHPTSPALPIVAAEFLGVYDATPVESARFFGDKWIGVVSGTAEDLTIAIFFDGHSSFGASGALDVADGTLEIVGERVYEDDIHFLPEGRATLSRTRDAQTITGTDAPADEIDEQTTRQGTFSRGDCLVSASGRLRCDHYYATTFVPPPGTLGGGSFIVTLTGQLVAADDEVAGSGVTSAPIFPHAYVLGGEWRATRVGGVAAQGRK